MSNTFLAAVCMILLSASTYSLLRFAFGAPAEVASGFAGFFILAMGQFRDYLEQSQIKRRERKKHVIEIPNMQSLMLSYMPSIFLGVILVFSSIQVSSFFAGIALSIIDSSQPEALPLLFSLETIGVLAFPIQFIFVFYISRWLSINTKKHMLACIVVSVLLGRFLSGLFDSFLLSNVLSEEADLITPIQSHFVALWYTLILSPFWLSGWFFGKRRREAEYLAFLIGGLSPIQKKVLTEIALEEVVELRRKAMESKNE